MNRWQLITLMILVVASSSLKAEESSSGSFDRVMQYVNDARNLNETFELLQEQRLEIDAQQKDLLARFKLAKAELTNIELERDNHSLAILAKSFEVSNLIAVHNANTRVVGRPTIRRPLRQVLVDAAPSRQLYLLQQERMQLDVAKRFTSERLKEIYSLQLRTMKEVSNWTKKSNELSRHYFELSDLQRIRTDVELRAVLRELSQANSNNGAAGARKNNYEARLAAAMTLIRLDRHEEIAAVYRELQSAPVPFPALATAVKAFSLGLQGQVSESDSLFDNAQAQVPEIRVLLIRAQCAAECGKITDARKQWLKILEHGEYELAARRGLALAVAATHAKSGKHLSGAIENARLAVALTGNREWSSLLTLAVCQHKNGNWSEAQQTATEAERVALFEHKDRCREILEKIRAREKCLWEF